MKKDRASSFFSGLLGRMLLSIGLALFVGLGVLAGIVTLQVTQKEREAAVEFKEKQSAEIGLMIGNRLNSALDVARTLAQTLEAVLRTPYADREAVNLKLRSVVAANPNLLAVWTLWEPNAFDGRDAEFAHTPGHDGTGRFIPYWSRGEKGLNPVEPLLAYEKPGPGDYYLIARRTNREVVMEPFIYPVAGKDTLITCLVVPVRDQANGNKFVGVVGVDMALDVLSAELKSLNIGRSAYASLVSNGGVYVAHPLEGYTGKPVVEKDAWIRPYLADIAAGRAFEANTYS